MGWEPGRSGGGYEKFKVVCTRRFDIHLLRMKKGTEIHPHTDPCDYAMHRVNIILRPAKRGGVFDGEAPHHVYSKGRVRTLFWGRLIYFRPDIVKHWVSKVEEGTRLVLSIAVAV